MTRAPLDLDIAVRERSDDGPPTAVASVLFAPELAAAASGPEAALDRLRDDLTTIADTAPRRLAALAHTAAPEIESVPVDLPAPSRRRLHALETTLHAVLRPTDTGFRVALPEIAADFHLDARDQLETLAREHTRLAIPVGSRPEAVARLGPADRRDLRLETLSVALPDDADDRPRERSLLEQIGEPLQQLQDRKDAPGAFHRDETVAALLQCLADVRERSALLIGPSGVGKTAVVLEAVNRIVAGDAPSALADTPVWRVSGGRLTGGAGLGDWQQTILEIIDELEASGGVLVVDNLAELLGTGANGERDGAAGLLLPEIQSGNISLVTELRPEQVGVIEERHPTLIQALRPFRLDPMTGAETDAVLERVSYRLGRRHGVRLADQTRQSIIGLVERFYGAETLPGRAVDLAERIARTHRDESVNRDGHARPLLVPDHAVDAMATQTGLPPALLDSDTDFSVDRVRDHFEAAVFDQPQATGAMTDLVTILRSGLNPPERPMGSYLFVGPTGVGKTQTALALADYLFGSEDRLLRFDMSEYQDRWSAARLVGRARSDPGQLVRRVREQPFRVLLLDEIEKAHDQVFDILLQVLDEGRLTDGLGQTVRFINTVLIMTSNLGAGGPAPLADEDRGVEKLREYFVDEVESHFRPEFVGRLDRVVPFDPLGDRTARRLAKTAVDEALAREGIARRNLTVEVDDAVVDYLADIGFDDRYGARPLRQTVESEITARLADFLAARPDLTDTTIRIELVDGAPTLRT